MSDDIKNILLNDNADDKNQSDELQKYLKGELSNEEQYAFEKKMMANDFESDAQEGLEGISNQKMDLYIYQLNKVLKEKTKNKKSNLSKRALKPQWWLYFSVLVFLLIIILLYFYLHRAQ